MSDRDKYGNYVNDKGVTIKISTDKKGNDHLSFYGGEVDKAHDAAHVNINMIKILGVQQRTAQIKAIQIPDLVVVI